jgi:hypothetical protein
MADMAKEQEPAIQEYRVNGEMGFAADSPAEAARQAHAHQLKQGVDVRVFEVEDTSGKLFKVDLDELDGVGVG